MSISSLVFPSSPCSCNPCAPQHWNTCWEAASSSGTWPRGLLMGHRGLPKYAAGSCGRGHTFTLQGQRCLSPATSSSPVFLCKGNLVTNKASSLESGLTLNLEQRRVCLSPLRAHCICGLYFLIGFNSVFLFLAARTGCLEGAWRESEWLLIRVRAGLWIGGGGPLLGPRGSVT